MNKEIELLVKKINKFSEIAKKRKLTKAEVSEQDKIRQKYLAIFRSGFEQNLQNLQNIKKD